MMAISGLELCAAVAWLLGATVVAWGLRAHHVEAAVAAVLVVVMTMIPIVGPVAAVGVVVRRRSALAIKTST